MNNNYLPMLPYFYEQASIERERVRAIDKARESREAIQGHDLIAERTSWNWSDDERKEKFGAIIKTLKDADNETETAEYDF